jgi:hypothetical protein
MNLYEAKTGVVLKQHMVPEKEGELSKMKAFLTPTLLKGRIISADALYTKTSLLSGGHCLGRRLFALGEAQSANLA